MKASGSEWSEGLNTTHTAEATCAVLSTHATPSSEFPPGQATLRSFTEGKGKAGNRFRIHRKGPKAKIHTVLFFLASALTVTPVNAR